jgi:FAD/FMN-containing dehydrogenase
MIDLAAKKSLLYRKLKSVVGAENVTDREVVLDAYMGTVTITMSVGMDKVPGMLRDAAYEVERPGFVVRAGSKEEAQAIVRLANQYKIPIIPMGALTSTYYETVPSQGCIMLDFSRMNRIELDEDMMTVTFEPGVTWAQAYRDLAAKGYWVSNQASPGSVSILGTTSQAGMHLPMNKHAIVYSTYYSDLTIGLEVVLPNGELLVTGSAAFPGARPQSARAYGPNLGAIFLGAQGTLGIVVKQTLPLWRIPETHVFVQGNFKYENFKGLANAMHRIVEEQFKGPIWAEQIWAIYDGTGKFGEWEFYAQIFGSKSFVEPLKKFVEKVILDEGGKVISNPRILEPETDYSPQMYEEMIYWRPRANSICTPPTDISSIGFALGGVAAYDKLSELHEAALKLLAKHKVARDKINRGMAWTLSRSGAIWYSLSYLYNKNDVEEVKRANAIREEWDPIRLQILGEKASLDVYFGMSGGMPYRLTPAAAKTGLPKLGEYYKLLVQLKRMLDPNRIMNPGKFMDIEPY